MTKFVKNDLVTYNQIAKYFIEEMMNNTPGYPSRSEIFVVVSDEDRTGKVEVYSHGKIKILYREDLESVGRQ